LLGGAGGRGADHKAAPVAAQLGVVVGGARRDDAVVQPHSSIAKRARRDDRKGSLVLKHLEEQTALTFTREKRSIRILFVQRAVASKQLFMKSGK
jgi:hypothetical protein